MKLLFDTRYNKVVSKQEELRNGQIRVKEYNSFHEYDTWGIYLITIEQAIKELKAKQQDLEVKVKELECLI
jgi:hypothetical protein